MRFFLFTGDVNLELGISLFRVDLFSIFTQHSFCSVVFIWRFGNIAGCRIGYSSHLFFSTYRERDFSTLSVRTRIWETYGKFVVFAIELKT